MPQRIDQAAAAQIAHDDVGAVRFAPEIKQRDDEGAFQPGDQLCFHLEIADKVGVVGILWQDNLDSDFALKCRLERTIDRAKPARAQRFAQFVPFDDLSAEIVHDVIFHLSHASHV